MDGCNCVLCLLTCLLVFVFKMIHKCFKKKVFLKIKMRYNDR